MELEHHTKTAYNLGGAGFLQRQLRKVKNVAQKTGVLEKPVSVGVPVPSGASEGEPGFLRQYGLYIAAALGAWLVFRRK